MSASERLSTLDESGWRQRVIPAEVRGRYHTWRKRTDLVLLAIFLGLPWMKIGGLQAVWLDIAGRRFELFGTLFLAHDAPKLFLILIAAVTAIALATALWGRVWCGWACPQTVFIEAVFRRIEIWIEGTYIERRKLYAQPMNFRKFRLLTLKWTAYLLVSSILAHSFIAYFAGRENLLAMMSRAPSENRTYFFLVLGITLLTAFNFGWFREQFCFIVCPYGRFQSVLMDESTINVQYDHVRGEPRKAGGDCVACNRCVQVCPSNIDIRHGLQMECIGCTACIDACDEIMRKVKKPEGLIRYASADLQRPRILRPRVMAYSVLLLATLVGFAFACIERTPFSVAVLRATDVPYQVLPNGMVLNHFKVHVLNQSHLPQTYRLILDTTATGAQLTQGQASGSTEPGEATTIHLFIQIPGKELTRQGRARIPLMVEDEATHVKQATALEVVGPMTF